MSGSSKAGTPDVSLHWTLITDKWTRHYDLSQQLHIFYFQWNTKKNHKEIQKNVTKKSKKSDNWTHFRFSGIFVFKTRSVHFLHPVITYSEKSVWCYCSISCESKRGMTSHLTLCPVCFLTPCERKADGTRFDLQRKCSISSIEMMMIKMIGYSISISNSILR